MTRETWGSRFGFIMATAGFAIGLGNIWRFPYMTGMNGGGAFLLVYLVVVAAIGLPLLMIEIGLGRKAQLSPIAGFARLHGPRSPWGLIGWLGMTAAVMINAYYLMIIGWIVGYTIEAFRGSLHGLSAEQLSAHFAAVTTTPGPLVAYTLLTTAALTLVVRRGLGGGVERLSRIAMPALFLLLVALAVRSLTLPGAGAGLAWYLTPDFSVVTAGTWLAALGQAFFSIGVGMAAGFAFGGYMDPRRSDVPGSVALVVVADTAVAVGAGLIIFPALFAFGLAPDSGPGLLFVTIPQVFSHMPGGMAFGAAFFVLLFLAGVTSAVALFEVVTASCVDSLGLSRPRAALATGALWAVLSTVVILGEGPWAWIQPFGLTLFGLLDSVSTNVLLPVGGLLLALYTAVVWTFDGFMRDVNEGAGTLRVTGLLRPFVLVVIPVAVALVLLTSLGVL